MSAPSIDRASALKIARNLGRAGRPLPEAMAGDAEYEAAHAEASGLTPAPTSAPTPPPAKKAPAKKAPAKKAAPTRPARKSAPRQPARTRPASPAPPSRSTRPGYVSRAFSPSAAAGRVADATGMRRVARGGDAGGLLLVLVLWPLALATVKYGAEGPLIWFRAKWLNQPTAASGAWGERTDPIVHPPTVTPAHPRYGGQQRPGVVGPGETLN